MGTWRDGGCGNGQHCQEQGSPIWFTTVPVNSGQRALQALNLEAWEGNVFIGGD
jgi:hypothetical protein